MAGDLEFLGGLEDVEPESEFTVIPVGTYPAVIEKAEVKISKKGGQYVPCVYQIIDGPFKNRRVWDNMNVVNANPTAQQMGRERLKLITNLLGVTTNDTSSLCGKPLTIKLSIDKRDPDRNIVKSIHKYAGAVQSAQPPVAAPPPATPAEFVPSVAPATGEVPF
jgi:hypothetical protein